MIIYNTTGMYWTNVQTLVWNISHSNKNWVRCDKKKLYIGLHVKDLLHLSDFDQV
jgi:hypothetical protein